MQQTPIVLRRNIGVAHRELGIVTLSFCMSQRRICNVDANKKTRFASKFVIDYKEHRSKSEHYRCRSGIQNSSRHTLLKRPPRAAVAAIPLSPERRIVFSKHGPPVAIGCRQGELYSPSNRASLGRSVVWHSRVKVDLGLVVLEGSVGDRADLASLLFGQGRVCWGQHGRDGADDWAGSIDDWLLVVLQSGALGRVSGLGFVVNGDAGVWVRVDDVVVVRDFGVGHWAAQLWVGWQSWVRWWKDCGSRSDDGTDSGHCG